MTLKTIKYEKKGKIAYVTLNRPEKLNAFTYATLEELKNCWKDFNDDNNLWVAIFSGEGKSFCAGHDFTAKEKTTDQPSSLHYGGIEVNKPIIAAVRGYALGAGCSMALACDVIVCSEDARFGYPQARLGLISTGGPVRLARLLPSLARWYLYSGEYIDAREAYRLGLVVKVVPTERLMDEATKMAERLCESSPSSVKYTKQAVERGKLLTLGEALLMSKHVTHEFEATEDYKEAVAAFKEKRKPVWKGK